ncbi:MAG: class I SAM-dependent methyltransferase [Gemmataceae bacterium]|nr:class I SAM-dependent methyltransferase [Gemmataceae bacterium]MDW8265361.1 class I SAM-dependent methyltransferase [Gemmataceae bacterium]
MTPATAPSLWADSCHWLQCPDCAQGLAPADAALACTGCHRTFRVRDGFLDVMPPLTGNNKVVAEFYDSPNWPKFRFWEWFTFLLNGGERRARSHIMKHLPHLAECRLLEVAIGDGANLPLIPPSCEVWGIDISIIQLRGCRQRCPDRPLRLLLGEAEKLPFRDSMFDHVLSVGAFNYFNDPVQSLREMARVVKPGGRIVVADEYPDLPNRLIGHRIGLPQLDRWVMSRFLHLGPEFTDIIDRHRDMKLEPIVRAVLDDWQIYSLWHNVGYCIVGQARKG